MLHSRTMINKTNRIDERALRALYSDYNSSFKELLDKDGSFTIHQRNVHSSAVESYKSLHGLSPAILTILTGKNLHFAEFSAKFIEIPGCCFGCFSYVYTVN